MENVIKNTEKQIKQLSQKAKRHDIPVQIDFDITENRYRNRRHVRDLMNQIAGDHFRMSKDRGWDVHINIDLHTIDRLSDREFPFDEFVQIIAKLGTRNEQDVLDLVEKKLDGGESAHRINCHGHGAWMVGINLQPHVSEDGTSKSYHIMVRTCYAERNMISRERNVSVHRIWTRGMPQWLKEAQAANQQGEMND